MIAWFALAAICLFAAALFVPRLAFRVMRVATAAPARVPAAADTAAPVVTIQPSGAISGPFAYDNGLISEAVEGDTS